MLLRRVLVNGSTRNIDGFGVELLCLPDEILKQVALVLGQKEVLRLLHHFSEISNERLSFARQLG